MTAREYFLKIDKYLDSKFFFDLLELDFFSYLSVEGNYKNLSKELLLDENLIKRILRIGCEKGWILEKKDGYVNTKEIDYYFNRSSPNFIGDLLLNKMKNLDYKSIKELNEIKYNSSQKRRGINTSSKEIELLRLHIFSDLISDLSIKKALDLGCGSGLFGMEVARKFKDSEVVLFDKSNVMEKINQDINSGNIKCKAGNFLVDHIGESYDLIIASGILDFAYKDLDSFMIKMRDSLKDGGHIFVYSLALDENPEVNTNLRWLSGFVSSEVIPVTKDKIVGAIEKSKLEIVKKTEDEIYPLWILKKRNEIEQ